MFSRSYAPLIHTPTQTSPDTSMNAIYAGTPSISSVHFVGSAAASCSNLRIPSTDCLTGVDFYEFTHNGSRPSTAFTGVNIPFAAGMPIVVWQHFTITEWNVLKYTLPLRLIYFRACRIFSCLSSYSSMQLSAP